MHCRFVPLVLAAAPGRETGRPSAYRVTTVNSATSGSIPTAPTGVATAVVALATVAATAGAFVLLRSRLGPLGDGHFLPEPALGSQSVERPGPTVSAPTVSAYVVFASAASAPTVPVGKTPGQPPSSGAPHNRGVWTATPLDNVDLAILEFLVDHRSPTLTAVPMWLGILGMQFVPMGLLVLVALVLAVHRRAWRQLAAVGTAVLTARIVVGVLKDVIERPRPPADLTLFAGSGFAFPSTHAAFTAAAATAMVCVTSWRSPGHRTAAIAALWAALVLIGVSMVYLGSHWTSDVLVGWALGVGIGFVIGRALGHRGKKEAGASRPRAAEHRDSTESGHRPTHENQRRSRG